jgi:hypothetical protein
MPKKFYEMVYDGTTLYQNERHTTGSAVSNGRKTKSCLGQVFHSRLGSFAALCSKCFSYKQPLLELKTRPKFSPVSSSLSVEMVKLQREGQNLGRVLNFRSGYAYTKAKLPNFKLKTRPKQLSDLVPLDILPPTP